jgi:hypothetical protein
VFAGCFEGTSDGAEILQSRISHYITFRSRMDTFVMYFYTEEHIPGWVCLRIALISRSGARPMTQPEKYPICPPLRKLQEEKD